MSTEASRPGSTARIPPRSLLTTIFCAVLILGAVAALHELVLASSPSPNRSQALPTTFTSPLWRSGGPYGGDVEAVALSPAFQQDGFALAGGWRMGWYGPTGGYGIARTTDGGATWQLLQDEVHRWMVFSLAVSPDFATDGTAFAGTDVGLLRSTDRGDNWIWLYDGLPRSTQGSSELDDIVHLRLSPAFGEDRTLFALPRRPPGDPTAAASLYRSTNGGDAWTSVLSGAVSAVTLAHDYGPAGSATVYAATFDGADSLIQRSPDRGQTWAPVYLVHPGEVNDLLALPGGELLLATANGVRRLVPSAGGFADVTVSGEPLGPVNRLAVAGDRVYAAAQGGLYVTTTDGQSWARVSGAPWEPFLALAACPERVVCRSVLAGAHSGLIFAGDDTLPSWQRLDGPLPLSTNSVVTSPSVDGQVGRAVDNTLFAATAGGVFRSTDRGAHWDLMTAGAACGGDCSFRAVRISPGYALDGTVYASFEDRTLERTALYSSTDRGATWSVQEGRAGTAALGLSPAYPSDRTLFYARDDTLHRSIDAGATWTSHPIDPALMPVLKLAVSPGYATDRTLYVTGYGGVRRSVDGGATWQAMKTYGPAYDIVLSPAYAFDRTAWHTFRAIEPPGDGTPESAVVRTVDGGATWKLAPAGLPGVYEPFPLPLAASPHYSGDRALFTGLYGQFVAGSSHSLYRGLDGGRWWTELGPAPGNPNLFDLAVTELEPGSAALGVHLATSQGVWHFESPCEERLANGGFEVEDVPRAWELPHTPATAAVGSAHVHTGAKSVRIGIDGVANVYSYSSAVQTIAIPSGSAVTLSFWWRPLSGEGPLASDSPAGDVPAGYGGVAELEALLRAAAAGMGMSEEAGAAAPAGSDRQYVLLLDADGAVLKSLLWTRSNAASWQEKTFDVSAFQGRSVQVVFGVMNDGKDGATAVYVDDVSVTACRSSLARMYLPVVLKRLATVPTVTPTRTATPTRTPTATPTPTQPPAPPAACYAGLTNGGFEATTGWILRSNPVPASYVTSPVHGGGRSMRTGIPAGGANTASYSPIEQAVTLPAGLASVRLSFWRYSVYGDDGQTRLLRLPSTEAGLAQGIDANDVFYVIAIKPDGAIQWLFTESLNQASWRQKTLDVTGLQGQTVRLQFGTYNNGTGGISRTYVDDAKLDVCPPAGALVIGADSPRPGWVQRVAGRPDAATLYAMLNAYLFRSDDAGLTWRMSGSARPEPTLLGDGTGTLYAGAGTACYAGGDPPPAWRTMDGGASWQTLPAALGLKPLAASAGRPWLYLAGCNGPNLSTDGGNTVTHQPDPLFGLYDVIRVAPAGDGWSTVWAGGMSEGGNAAVLVSRNGGASWSQSTPPELDMGPLGDVLVDRFTPGAVYAAVYRGFFYSLNDGASWQTGSIGLENVVDPGGGGPAYGLQALAQSPRGDHALYLGTAMGLYRLDWAGGQWQKITGQPFDALAVTGLLMLDAAPDRLYVTTPLGVFVYHTDAPAAMAAPASTPWPTTAPTRTFMPPVTR